MELHTKHRPKTLDEVVGHAPVVAAIRSTLAEKRSRAFLLVGPPGTGKTTLARCIAAELGVGPVGGGYLEFDGSVNTGVDDARSILAVASRRSLTKTGRRVVVVDECHYLSKNAWSAMLKAVEEPTRGLAWVFCTSEGTKVPAAIRSRCQEYALGPLSHALIGGLIAKVATAEKIRMREEVLDVLLKYADGSPRRALVGLGMVADCRRAEDAQQLLAGAVGEDHPEVIDLCRALASKDSQFPRLAGMVLKLQGKITAEGVRHVILSYFSKMCVGSSWRQAVPVVTAFGQPYHAGIGDSMVPVLVSLASIFDA